jgi:quercetin dioxygenase-like cupin family protein
MYKKTKTGLSEPKEPVRHPPPKRSTGRHSPFLSEDNMKKVFLVGVFGLLGLGSGSADEKVGHDTDMDHVVARPETIKWGPGPASLPPGARLAVLLGQPGKKGLPFVIRAKFSDGYKVPPHWHPTDENVTVLKGTLLIGRGDTFDPAKTEELPTGSFMRMPKGMRHFAMAKGETILQIHGIGPFEIHYVNPADDPRAKDN